MEGYEDDVSLSPASPSRELKEPKAEPVGDDDVYEDSQDLDTSQQSQRVMLVRLPEYLMEKLRANGDELHGADLGKVLIPQGPGSDPKKMRVLLNPQIELLRPLPHRYDMTVIADNVENVYVMREQEIRRRREASREASQAAPAGGVSKGGSGATSSGGPGSGPSSGLASGLASGAAGGAGGAGGGGSGGGGVAGSRSAGGTSNFFTRRAKRTALVGHAVNDCVLTADMSDPNYRYVLRQRKAMEMPDPERQTVLLDNMAGVGSAQYGATLRQGKEAWQKSVLRQKAQREHSDGKASRTKREILLDLLFQAFDDQEYWGVRQLRERTHQPESFLREVLDTIAVLIKRGPNAMKYTLREEFKVLMHSGAGVENLIEAAPKIPEPDDDDVEMENVEIA